MRKRPIFTNGDARPEGSNVAVKVATIAVGASSFHLGGFSVNFYNVRRASRKDAHSASNQGSQGQGGYTVVPLVDQGMVQPVQSDRQSRLSPTRRVLPLWECPISGFPATSRMVA